MVKHGIKNKFKSQAAQKTIKKEKRERAYQACLDQMLERAEALAAENHSVNSITKICKREGLWNKNKQAPFSEHSIRYHLKKKGIKTKPRHKPAPSSDHLRELFTRSLKNMGFSPREIEAELKSLIK